MTDQPSARPALQDKSVLDAATALLEEGIGRGPWLPLQDGPVQPGQPILHIYQHVLFDAASDAIFTETITIRNRQHAYAERLDEVEGQLWQSGPAPLTDVLAALRALPSPGKPGAPTRVLRTGIPNPT